MSTPTSYVSQRERAEPADVLAVLGSARERSPR
jgi:hypothetical protein